MYTYYLNRVNGEKSIFILQFAKKFHPDVNKDDPKAGDKFAEISEAYEVSIS